MFLVDTEVFPGYWGLTVALWKVSALEACGIGLLGHKDRLTGPDTPHPPSIYKPPLATHVRWPDLQQA